MSYLWGMRRALSAGGSALRTNRFVWQGGGLNYIIIGSGVAGIAAIEAIRAEDQEGSIVMIGDDPHGFYSRPGLAYYLTGELHDKALFPRTVDDYRRMNFRYVRGRVIKILRDQHVLQLGDKTNLEYDRLLIAVGA